MPWKRPDSVPFPSVWSTFQGKPHGDYEPIEYKIQDITEDLMEGAIEHMVRYFLIRENTCSSTGFVEEKLSVKEIEDIWATLLKQRMGLVCLATDPESGEEKIAGVNMTCISEKDEEKPKFKGKLMNQVWDCLSYLQKDVNVFEKYNTDVYMAALGLSVAPQYHGDNIGYELLMARTPLCQATGVPVTITAFTGPASQHVGKKAGFYKLTGFEWKDYKPNGKIIYPRLTSELILMAKEIKCK